MERNPKKLGLLMKEVKSSFRISCSSLKYDFSVADKWLNGGITKIGEDQYVSNNSPYNKQWGQTQWHYSGK